MTDKLRIVFAGTPEISRTVLAKILENGFKVELVLTQPDRPAGRGLKLTPSPVKELALSHGIEVFQPSGFRKDPSALAKIRELAPDIIVVVAYGLILPQALLDIPRLGCINIHVSLLPKWRGAAPIQRAVLAGDKASGVTIMQMDAGLDTGDMLIVVPVELASDETSGSLHDKLAQIGATNIVEFLRDPAKYPPQKQIEAGVSYANKIDKEEARINWSEHAELIERKIRGYNPFPGAFTYLEGKLHKIWQAELVDVTVSNAPAGTIVDSTKDKLWVVGGDGKILAVIEIQEAGSKRKTINQYLQGKNELINQRFTSE